MSNLNNILNKVLDGFRELSDRSTNENFKENFDNFVRELPRDSSTSDSEHDANSIDLNIETRLENLENASKKRDSLINSDVVPQDLLPLDSYTPQEPYEIEYGVLQGGPVDEELSYISVKPSSSDGTLNTDLGEIDIATFSDGGLGWVTLAASAVVTFVRLERTRTVTPGTPIVYGQLLSNLQNSQIFAGAIMLWSGAIVDIPTGWALCDGTGDTPDLTDRFVIGARIIGNYTVGAFGGYETHGVTENNHTSHEWDHSHDIERGPYLTHRYDPDYSVNSVITTGSVPSYEDLYHSDSSNMPPYYALAYIMKL